MWIPVLLVQERSDAARSRAQLEMPAAGAMRAAAAPALRGLFCTDPRCVRMASNAARELARGFGLTVPVHSPTEKLLAVFIVGVCVCVLWRGCAVAVRLLAVAVLLCGSCAGPAGFENQSTLEKVKCPDGSE
jgi:hypothetical protein